MMGRMGGRPPGFPLIPFFFPIGMAMGLLALTALFQYRIWRELEDSHHSHAHSHHGESYHA